MNSWKAEAIAALLESQGVRLAPGRAEKIAAALNAANTAYPLRDALELEADPTGYLLALERCK